MVKLVDRGNSPLIGPYCLTLPPLLLGGCCLNATKLLVAIRNQCLAPKIETLLCDT